MNVFLDDDSGGAEFKESVNPVSTSFKDAVLMARIPSRRPLGTPVAYSGSVYFFCALDDGGSLESSVSLCCLFKACRRARANTRFSATLAADWGSILKSWEYESEVEAATEYKKAKILVFARLDFSDL